MSNDTTINKTIDFLSWEDNIARLKQAIYEEMETKFKQSPIENFERFHALTKAFIQKEAYGMMVLANDKSDESRGRTLTQEEINVIFEAVWKSILGPDYGTDLKLLTEKYKG